MYYRCIIIHISVCFVCSFDNSITLLFLLLDLAQVHIIHMCVRTYVKYVYICLSVYL